MNRLRYISALAAKHISQTAEAGRRMMGGGVVEVETQETFYGLETVLNDDFVARAMTRKGESAVDSRMERSDLSHLRAALYPECFGPEAVARAKRGLPKLAQHCPVLRQSQLLTH